MMKKGLIKSFEIEKKTLTEDGKFLVSGWASKSVVDRVDDLVLPTAFQKSVERFTANPNLMPPLLLEHMEPVGKIVSLDIRQDGLFITAEIAKGYEEADKARKMVEQGVIKYFSIGFILKDADWQEMGGQQVRVIKDLDLLEISLVAVPACQDAVFEMDSNGKMVKVSFDADSEMKKASGSLDWPLAPRDRLWNHDEAEARIRKWASKDGSGDKDKMDWKKYASVHFWYDENNPNKFTSYKLLFCDVVDGKVMAVPRGIFACAVVVQGGRGGLDIPESDLPAVKKKIAAYYHKMDEKAPWEKSLIVEDIKSIVSEEIKSALTSDEFKRLIKGCVEEVIKGCVVKDVKAEDKKEDDEDAGLDDVVKELEDLYKKVLNKD